MAAEVAAPLTWPVLAAMAIVLVARGYGRQDRPVAHEGGHMVIGALTGGRVKDFELDANQTGGGTTCSRAFRC